MMNTRTVVIALSMSGCFLGGSAPSGTTPATGKTGVFLEYNNTYDQQGDDVGGAKTEVDVPLVWTGARVQGGEQTGQTFTQNTTWHGYATDPWYATTIVPNLDPGDWNLSVTVNGQPFSCPTPITLAQGVQSNVTFQIDKQTGQFTGCTH